MKVAKHSTFALALLAMLSFAATAQAHGNKNEGGQASLSPDQITQVQNKLNEKGYDVGKADGVIGKKTEQGIKKFQKDNNEAATGHLDSKTLAALGVQEGATQQSGMAGQSSDQQQQKGQDQSRQQPGTSDQSQSQGQSQAPGTADQGSMDQNNYPAGN